MSVTRPPEKVMKFDHLRQRAPTSPRRRWSGATPHTDRDFLIVDYALDRSATINQGVQGSGIDRVQLFMDGPSGTPMAKAELGFSDATPRRLEHTLPTAAFG